MPDNFFTLMIIPRRKSAVKKISLSSALVRALFVGSIFAVLSTFYIIYDYASIKRDRAELARLKVLTKEQSQQIHDLAAKIDDFSDRMEELLKSDHAALVVGMHKEVAKLHEDADIREKSFSELMNFLREQKSLLAATPSIWPVKGWITSEFGVRESPFNAGSEFHKGLDIATRMNKEVLATADGIVVEASYQPEDGNIVKIDHSHGIVTAYAHLAKSAVQQGVRVKRGDLIGYVGDTGRSTGSHLHYAVYINKIPVNPRKYLK
ncbi:MAG TPA: M23 family metallopeptidase [Smithellaceae bacterium]|nr:M23 family metallopeptidase [Smithellaceae bacterium]